jgi:hypothetical protein
MAIIYETINLYNKEHGINPWRYIGSDQYNDPSYFGSSINLKKDILVIGVDKFVKNVLEDCGEITNKELRKIESEKYLKPNKVRLDSSYYNKSDSYSPGCGQKGMKHSQKFVRTEKWKISRIGHEVGEDTRKLMALKKQGTLAKDSTRRKMSDQRIGENNINALSWTVITPLGEVYNVVALRAWARNNNHNFYEVYHSKNGWNTVRHGTGKGGGRKKKEISSGN